MRVEVYWNLHKSLFSMRAMSGPNKGLVVAHCNRIVLETVSLSVSEKGRQKVLTSGQKNVHAFIRGDLRYFQGQSTLAAGGFCSSEYPFGTAKDEARAEGMLKRAYYLKNRVKSYFSYNPRTAETFTLRPTPVSVTGAEVVDLTCDLGAMQRFPVCEGVFSGEHIKTETLTVC